MILGIKERTNTNGFDILGLKLLRQSLSLYVPSSDKTGNVLGE